MKHRSLSETLYLTYSPDIRFSKSTLCNSGQHLHSDNSSPEDLLSKNLSFDKILPQGTVVSLTRLELRHPSEELFAVSPGQCAQHNE